MMSLLLDARLEVQSLAGRRTIEAQDFFLGALTTALEDGEMLVEVNLPKLRKGTGWAFEEVARRSGDFALACVAVTLNADGGKISDVRIGMGEGGTIGAPAAVANAVADAVAPLGIDILELPISPERLFRLIENSKHRKDSAHGHET